MKQRNFEMAVDMKFKAGLNLYLFIKYILWNTIVSSQTKIKLCKFSFYKVWITQNSLHSAPAILQRIAQIVPNRMKAVKIVELLWIPFSPCPTLLPGVQTDETNHSANLHQLHLQLVFIMNGRLSISEIMMAMRMALIWNVVQSKP